jgi:hypothetical protein
LYPIIKIKKTQMKTIYTLLALFMSMGLFAQEELTSFRGWEWGTSYNEAS